MKTDEQADSSRRLEEYRIRNEREPERMVLDEFEELPRSWEGMFLGKPDAR